MAMSTITTRKEGRAIGATRGITLLITLIFVSVMLSLGLELASLGYKQSVLASTALQSQSAFYAADGALECVLYADQQLNAFVYTGHDAAHPPPATVCDGTAASVTDYCYNSAGCANGLRFTERFSLDGGSHCADVTAYKTGSPDAAGRTTYLFAQGYNASCSVVSSLSGSRVTARGLDIRY